MNLFRAKAKPAELVRKEQNNRKKTDGKDAREQSSKEQIGKEQIGKEQTGKVQTRKVQTGKVQTGMVQIGKKLIGKKQIGKEQIGKEQIDKEQDGKEQGGNEQDGKEQDGKERNGKEQNVQGKTVCVKNNNKEENIEELMPYLEKNKVTEEKVETKEVEVGVWNIDSFIVVVSSEEEDQEIDYSPAFIKNSAGASEDLNNNEDIEQDDSYEDNRLDDMGEDHTYVKESRTVVKQRIPEECGEWGEEKSVLERHPITDMSEVYICL